jgi:hypothetical protein
MNQNEKGGKFLNKNVYDRLFMEPEGKDGFRGACGKTSLNDL